MSLLLQIEISVVSSNEMIEQRNAAREDNLLDQSKDRNIRSTYSTSCLAMQHTVMARRRGLAETGTR